VISIINVPIVKIFPPVQVLFLLIDDRVS